MRLPKMQEIPTSRVLIDAFGGYNHNLRIGDGEFYDMTNLTSSDYPVLSPRPKRAVFASPQKLQGMIAKEYLSYVDGGDFIVNGYKVPMGLSDGQKTLISMGAYIIILPDKMYINTEKLSDYGKIEASVTTTNTVTFELCKYDGESYGDTPKRDTAPSDPNNLDLWLDTSSTPNVLRQYSKANEQWVAIATTYIKISSPGIGQPFAEGDGVTISGIEDKSLEDLNNTMVIWARGDDYIVVTGIIDKVTSQDKPLKVERLMPTMDFIIESENRLWGCRYGVALNGEVVNEIYASKLGDFKNWNCFTGISTDSYVASVGSDGRFTGAITHLGYPLFFKENFMHKVYGNFPANYQIQTTACRGVERGSAKSLSIVNEVLYYKSRSAVCAYDGSLPVEMSSALGEVNYKDAVAGTLGNKYYISMADDSGEYHLFVYDTKKGMWHREDNTLVKEFCTWRGDLLYIDEKDRVMSVMGKGREDEKRVRWVAETGIIGTDMPDKKYISRLDVRLSITLGTRLYFYIQYDSSGEWEHVFTLAGRNLSSFSIPIKPRRCDHLRLKIEGDGEAKIFSICKTIEQGSNL